MAKKSKYLLEIQHTDHEGEQTLYSFHCVSVTRKQIKDAAREAAMMDEDDDSDPVVELAIKKFYENDTEIEDYNDIPIEVLTEAMERHPSFRPRDTGGANRRRGR